MQRPTSDVQRPRRRRRSRFSPHSLPCKILKAVYGFIAIYFYLAPPVWAWPLRLSAAFRSILFSASARADHCCCCCFLASDFRFAIFRFSDFLILLIFRPIVRTHLANWLSPIANNYGPTAAPIDDYRPAGIAAICTSLRWLPWRMRNILLSSALQWCLSLG